MTPEDLTKIILLSNVSNSKMDRFVAYCEHLGVLAGGGWGSGKATWALDPHTTDCTCKSTIPHINKITTEDMDLIVSWCKNNDIIVDNIMTYEEYDKYELGTMADEL